MLEQIARTAIAAGQAILPYYRSDEAGVVLKGDGSPVTLADVAAERVIVDALYRIAPDIAVVAEEAVASGAVPAMADRFFLVDPLDGTREFVGGSGEFTVNIALIEDGRPVFGVVHAPALGRIFVGESGHGARRAVVDGEALGAWRPIGVGRSDPAALRVVASRSHLSQETRDFVGRFAVKEFVSAGSSLKFCAVASGEADFYPRLGRTMEWDTAAGDAVLSAAGGSVVTMDGRPLRYGKRAQADDVDFANPWFVAVGGFDPLAAATATGSAA